MAQINITEKLVSRLAEQVAPLVEEATEWAIYADDMGERVLPKDRGYEELVLGRLRGAGVPVEDTGRGLLERLLEYVVENNALAAYEPSSAELLVVRENVDESNLNGLRLVVAHELVHRGQHVNHGNLFERVDEAIRQASALLSEGGGSPREALAKVQAVQPVMTLLESHAFYVQNSLRESHFPDAVIETHHNLAAVLFRIFGGSKLAQYRGAVDEVAEASQNGHVDVLYEAM